MHRQKGGFQLTLLIIILLAGGLLGLRYYTIANVKDPQTISHIKKQLDYELKTGGRKGMMESLNQGDIGNLATQALSLLHQQVVIIDVSASKPLLDFSKNAEKLYQVEFNVEQNSKVIATDIRYMSFQDTLSDGLRFRGNSTREAFFRRYLDL